VKAVAAGEQHASHVLYRRIKGRRFAIPDQLVPELQRCLENGRALQELLYQSALSYRKAMKQQTAPRAEKVKKRHESQTPKSTSPIWSFSLKALI
jgi:hypothetical protein